MYMRVWLRVYLVNMRVYVCVYMREKLRIFLSHAGRRRCLTRLLYYPSVSYHPVRTRDTYVTVAARRRVCVVTESRFPLNTPLLRLRDGENEGLEPRQEREREREGKRDEEPRGVGE